MNEFKMNDIIQIKNVSKKQVDVIDNSSINI